MGYWRTVGFGAVERAISNERLVRVGYFDLSEAYESIKTACITSLGISVNEVPASM